MKKLLFLGIFAIMLLGGGYGGYKIFGPKAAIAASDPGAVHSETGPPTFFEFKALMLPVMTQAGVQRFALVQVTLELGDKDHLDSVEAVRPRLRDAVFRALYDGFSTGEALDGDSIDIAHVKARIKGASRYVLGAGIVDGVLIQKVAQRRL